MLLKRKINLFVLFFSLLSISSCNLKTNEEIDSFTINDLKDKYKLNSNNNVIDFGDSLKIVIDDLSFLNDNNEKAKRSSNDEEIECFVFANYFKEEGNKTISGTLSATEYSSPKDIDDLLEYVSTDLYNLLITPYDYIELDIGSDWNFINSTLDYATVSDENQIGAIITNNISHYSMKYKASANSYYYEDLCLNQIKIKPLRYKDIRANELDFYFDTNNLDHGVSERFPPRNDNGLVYGSFSLLTKEQFFGYSYEALSNTPKTDLYLFDNNNISIHFEYVNSNKGSGKEVDYASGSSMQACNAVYTSQNDSDFIMETKTEITLLEYKGNPFDFGKAKFVIEKDLNSK